MFSAFWMRKTKIQGHLKLKRDPFWYGLGIYEDEDGDQWDVRGVIGACNPPYVQARLVACHPNYYGTAPWMSSAGMHRWEPYTIEVLKDLEMKNKTKEAE